MQNNKGIACKWTCIPFPLILAQNFLQQTIYVTALHM